MIAARLALAALLAIAVGPMVARAEAPPEPPIDVFLFLADWRTADGEVVVFDDLAAIPAALVPPPPGGAEATPPEAADAEPPEDVRALLSAEPKRWRRFTAEERARAIAGARLWSSFSDRERRYWRGRFTRWYSLPPEEREDLRARFSWWNRLSQEERTEIAATAAPPAAVARRRRQELDPALRSALRGLPREERRALERKLHAMDAAERQRFVSEELGL
jgi:hypothetical protein